MKHVQKNPDAEDSGPTKTQPNPTVNGRLLELFFGQVQYTPMGGCSGTNCDQGLFLHLHNCTSLEELALNADIGLVMIRYKLLPFQRLGLSSHTV